MPRWRTMVRVSWALVVVGMAATVVWGRSPGEGGEALGVEVHDPLEVGRSYTAWFHDGELSRLWSVFGEELRTLFGGEAGLHAFRDQVMEQLGGEAEVLAEHAAELGGEGSYTRTSRFEAFDDPFVIQFSFDGEGTVSVFGVRPRQPEAPSEFVEYRTRAELRLPFEGDWLVYWGGRKVEENYHAAHPDQRYAYDLVAVEEGRRYRGDGRRNEDYACFGRPIVAPAAAVVAFVLDGVPDNVPGEMNPRMPAGNYVVLDHGAGEYSFLAHLREGTVHVSEGDRVETGDLLGECGNSGNTSEPHLHYHLQTTPELGAGAGLPAQFNDYLADGEPVERGEPVQGQRIRARGGEGSR